MRLLERASHLSSLMEYAVEARSGEGRLVLIAGEAGVGKSSLLDQLDSELVDSRWYAGACDGLFTPRPLAPLLDIARQLGGELGALCDNQAPRDQLFAALLKELIGPGGLTVLAIEDVHWADEATLDLLRFVGRRVRDARALVLVTYRDDSLAADDPLRIALGELSMQRTTRRLSLPPLSFTAVAELAAGTDVEVGALHRLTGGNPFYVSEALQASSGELPGSVRDAVLARVAPLSRDARHVLDVASLVGGRVRPDFLHAVVDATAASIDEIVASGALIGDGDRLRFRHEIARMAVQSAIPPHRAIAAHRAILDELLVREDDDDARLAYHAEGSADDALVLVHAPAAARRSAGLGAHREAAAQYERALRATCTDERALASLYDAWSTELAVLDRWEDAARAREDALRRWRKLGDRHREGDSLRRLSNIMWRLCRGDEAAGTARAALDTLEPLGPSEELAWAYATLAGRHMGDARYDDSIRLARRAQELGSTLGLSALLSDALNTEACSSSGLDGEWEQPLRRSLEIAKEAGLEEPTGRAYANLYSLCNEWMLLAQGESVYVEGVAFCDERDLHAFANCLRGERAHALERLGRWDEAETLVAFLLEGSTLSPVNRLNPLISIALVRARRGAPGLWEALDEAIVLADSLGQPEYTVASRLARAEACWLEDRVDEAVDDLRIAADAAGTLATIIQSSVGMWRYRITGRDPKTPVVTEPFAVEVSGDHRNAAERWAAHGLPFDAALALAGSDDEALLRESLDRLESLGATATARVVRAKMRRLGLRSVPTGMRATTKAHPAGLTRREQQVLELLCSGLTNDEISAQLVVSVKTVDHHVSAVLAKLGVPSRKVAAAEAARRGLVVAAR